MNNPLTKWAVQYLSYQLKKDKGYWIAWQANIAMSFIDELGNHTMNELSEEDRISMHKFANDAATRFLNLLTR